MAHITVLEPWIGHEKTLVITCHECPIDFTNEQDEQVFIYTCLGGILRNDDHLQEECIGHYLENKACTRIIFVGHYECKVMQRILEGTFFPMSETFFHYNVEALRKEYSKNMLRPAVKSRMIAELNALEQLKLLMRLEIVQQKIVEGSLTISGVMLDGENALEIFRNGLPFNNLFILN